jgi:hypothetical protein
MILIDRHDIGVTFLKLKVSEYVKYCLVHQFSVRQLHIVLQWYLVPYDSFHGPIEFQILKNVNFPSYVHLKANK